MSNDNIELARRGHEALMRGDLDAFRKLLSPQMTWHWWEEGPWDCESRDEAMAVIEERLSQNAIGELKEIIPLDDERILVVTGLRADSEIQPTDLGLSEDHDEIVNVLTFRDGKVIAMRDYRSKAEAVAATTPPE